jgi:hypothetical protein
MIIAEISDKVTLPIQYAAVSVLVSPFLIMFFYIRYWMSLPVLAIYLLGNIAIILESSEVPWRYEVTSEMGEHFWHHCFIAWNAPLIIALVIISVLHCVKKYRSARQEMAPNKV